MHKQLIVPKTRHLRERHPSDFLPPTPFCLGVARFRMSLGPVLRTAEEDKTMQRRGSFPNLRHGKNFAVEGRAKSRGKSGADIVDATVVSQASTSSS
jgi:hypothetical protein